MSKRRRRLSEKERVDWMYATMLAAMAIMAATVILANGGAFNPR